MYSSSGVSCYADTPQEFSPDSRQRFLVNAEKIKAFAWKTVFGGTMISLVILKALLD